MAPLDTMPVRDRSPLPADALLSVKHVSRETLSRLERYAALLARWQVRMNLVGRDTLDDPWRRHFLDSAQLAPLVAPDVAVITDLGSGAGFPGMVLAMLLDREVHLIEGNARKAAFLREVARDTNTAVTVHDARIETVSPWPTDVIVARALAPVSKLLGYAARFVRTDGAGPPTCLFLKGATVGSELTAAEERWYMRTQLVTSLSDPMGRVLQVFGFSERRHQS